MQCNEKMQGPIDRAEPDNQVQPGKQYKYWVVKGCYLSEIKQWVSIEGNWECHSVTEEVYSMIVLKEMWKKNMILIQ